MQPNEGLRQLNLRCPSLAHLSQRMLPQLMPQLRRWCRSPTDSHNPPPCRCGVGNAAESHFNIERREDKSKEEKSAGHQQRPAARRKKRLKPERLELARSRASVQFFGCPRSPPPIRSPDAATTIPQPERHARRLRTPEWGPGQIHKLKPAVSSFRFLPLQWRFRRVL